ncbi:hypothetical protein [Acetobacter orientalis]|uniref:hypothetical protein n=1 Tax=Acetobacter orientalis TaxID=146474 RepID=UPI0039ED82BA
MVFNTLATQGWQTFLSGPLCLFFKSKAAFTFAQRCGKGKQQVSERSSLLAPYDGHRGISESLQKEVYGSLGGFLGVCAGVRIIQHEAFQSTGEH